MTIEFSIAAFIAVLVLVYLLYALVRPDKF